MIFKNAKIFDDKFNLISADVEVLGDKIENIAPRLKGKDIYDLSGYTIVPGFVDIHIHGCVGADTCDAESTSIGKMAKHLITKGVTSFCPTTMTVKWEKILASISTVKNYMQQPLPGAAVCGINMEGPYISANKKGAQKVQYIRKPDWQEFKCLYDNCGGIIKLVDIAPECDDNGFFISKVSKFCRVSFAHSEANYEQTKSSFQYGISHVTHLFNAMTGFNHRMPGAVGAVFDNDTVKAEIICDGFHIHPAILRTTFRVLGEDRTIIISDSMRAAGMPDGISELGGQKVFVKNGQARLADNTIAGSTTNLYDEIVNLIEFGIPLRQIIKSATINPAVEIGEDSRIGSIKTGKDADIVVVDSNFNIKLVMAKGKIMVNNI